MSPKEMIARFLCPSCMSGPDEGCYELNEEYGCRCEKHRAGAFLSGVGRLYLGLPKGFNRSGDGMGQEPRMLVRLWPWKKKPSWDKFNVAVWALKLDGFLYVRTYSPRVNAAYVDVVEGGGMDLVPDAVDVAEFHEEMD